MFLTLLSIIFASPLFMEMEMDLSVKGVKLEPMKVLAEVGKRQTYTQKVEGRLYTLDVVPTVENDDEIHFEVEIKENKKAISSAGIITFDEQEAAVGLNQDEIQLKLVPRIL